MSHATKPGLLDRTRDGMKAVKAEVFANVPVEVQERLTEKGRLGVVLVVLGAVAGLYTLHLAVTLKDPDWKVLAVLGAPGVLLIMAGGSMISNKLWATVFGSVGALYRSIKGQAPPPEPAP